MQHTILGCDFCGVEKKGPPVFAVVTLTLANGRRMRGSPSLDLCARHQREVLRFFRPRRRPASKAAARATLGKTKAQGGTTTAKLPHLRHPEYWPTVERLVLAVIPKEPTRLPTIASHTALSYGSTYSGMRRLVKAGKVKRTGGGPHTRYQRAAGGAT
jgi:hypothetical protein